eukprot:5444102-Pleurochrysis_carterae.AAC.1
MNRAAESCCLNVLLNCAAYSCCLIVLLNRAAHSCCSVVLLNRAARSWLLLIGRAVQHAATLLPSVLPDVSPGVRPARASEPCGQGVREALLTCAEPCCALAASVLADTALPDMLLNRACKTCDVLPGARQGALPLRCWACR